MGSKIYARDFDKKVIAADREVIPRRRPDAAATTMKAATAAATVATAAFSDVGGVTGSLFQTVIQYTFFFSVIVLILFLLLVLLHYTTYPIFSFGPEDQGIIEVPTATNKQIAYTTSPTIYDRHCNFQGLYPINSTFALDVKLDADFSTTIPRILWYRSVDPVTMDAADTEDVFLTRFPASNIIVYLDPLKNDLKVAIQTEGGNSFYKETCVENVPLGKPFRVQFVVYKRFVEVYMAGQLYKTVQANGDLLQTPVDANVYGPPLRVGPTVKVANMVYWPYTVSPKMLRVQGTEQINASIFGV